MPCGFLVAEIALPLFLISTDFTLVTLRIQYLFAVSLLTRIIIKESGLWERVGEAGWGRAFHTGAVHGDKLYAFGGFNIFHFCFNDLLRYNLRNFYSSYSVFNKVNHNFYAVEEHGTAPNTFVEDMGALLNDPTLSDVVFVFPRDNYKKIYAHKNILSSRCAPLSAMLQSGNDGRAASEVGNHSDRKQLQKV